MSMDERERLHRFAIRELWDNPEIVHFLNKIRVPLKEAFADIVTKLFDKHIREDDKILELGSGLGWLLELVPQYKGRIVQTEGSKVLVDYRLRIDPATPIQVANIYDLRFDQESFDSVVALGVFDVLKDLPQACGQVKQVLRPNGRFIHMLDQIPDPIPMILHYLNEGYYPFPGTHALKPGDQEVGFHLISKEDYPLLHDGLQHDIPPLAIFMEKYVEDPCLYPILLAKVPELMEKVGTTLSQAPDILPIIKTPPQRDLFNTRLVSALEGSGFRITENGPLVASLILPRAEGRLTHPTLSCFSMINGKLTGIPFELGLPGDMTLVRANMNVVVAEAI